MNFVKDSQIGDGSPSQVLDHKPEHIETGITNIMRDIFRPYRIVKSLSEAEIKELARGMYGKKVCNMTNDNMLNFPLATILVYSIMSENQFDQNISLVGYLEKGMCTSMKVILSEDWNKAYNLYKKSQEIFDWPLRVF